MKLYLYGGSIPTPEAVDELINLFNTAIKEIKPKQFLHVPFCRTNLSPREQNLWGEGWMKKLNLAGVEFLSAANPEDLQKAQKPVIFVNGGKDGDILLKAVSENKLLKEVIVRADFYIGESAGAKFAGEFQTVSNARGERFMAKGLGILKKTIIVGHYIEKSRQEWLPKEMKESGATIGLGIDSQSGVLVDSEVFPNNIQPLGNGLFKVNTINHQ